MVESLVLSDSGKQFELTPAGNHPAVCRDLIDLGQQETPWGPKHKIQLVWQIDEYDSEKRRFLAMKRYTASLNENAILRKDLESWRGRAFTKDELKGFDIAKLVGVGAMINVVHRTADNGNTYANVVSVAPPPKGFQPWDGSDYERPAKYRDDESGTEEGYEDPAWMKDDDENADSGPVPF